MPHILRPTKSLFQRGRHRNLFGRHLGVGAFLFKAKKGTADAYEFTVAGLEDAYQAADNYKIFSGESNAGYELGWLCFKQQSNSYSAIGIGFSLKIATSPLFLLRNNNSEWEAYRLCLNK